ncbi:hypothetical protein C9374_009881 [Naegleria lovaniensis]|uniref:Uncharacterized protein n=1 Tax=Naegleria lovaniensis TaxID=51637 RepID=A0AA88KER2_NAELO|nr:uncharacterized protein C9374_009881 [Naegleria lovaniensis]KAG2375258.1 hypothetical protein C9374_009881 [Naegleria lovaniensis]
MSTPTANPKKPPRGHSQAPSPFFLKQQQANTHPSDTTSPNTYSPFQKQQQSPHTSFLSGSRITSPIHHPMTTNTTTSFDQHSFQEEQPSSFQEQQQPFNMSLFQQYSQQQEHYNDSNIFLNHEQHVIIPLSTCSFSTPLFSSIGESTPISPSRSRLSSKLGGELTVGEIEGEVIHISSPHDQLISYYCNRGGVIYPNIIIPHLLYGEESGYSTQQYEDSMMHDHGTNNNNNSSFLSHFIHTSIPLVSSHIYEYLQKLTRYIPYLQAMVSMKVPSYMLLLKRRNSLPPHSNNTSAMTSPTTTTTTATNNVTTTATTTTTTSSSTMNTTTTTPTPMNDDGVQCMDFHPFLMTMAILLHDDHIYFYNILNEEWSEQVLRHEFQFNVSMIKYKPTKQNESVLAVACEHGILIWDIHRRLPGMSHSTTMSAASSSTTTTMNSERMKDVSRNGVCVFLPSSTRVNGISWGVHSQQQYLLASSSLLDHRVFIWSCHESTNQDWKLLKTLTKFNGGVRHVEFSPDSKYLFVSHITNVFRVYETRNFDFCEKWSCFDQPVKSMAWHGSEYLFIVTEDSDCIHVLRDETSYLMNRTESTMWSTSSGGGNGHHHTMGGTSSGGGGSNGHTMGGTSSSGNGSSHPTNDEFHFEYQCKIPLALYSPFKTHSSLSHMKCCGKIRQIQVHGERLIVSFEQTPLLAVIQIDCSSTRHFICRPMGYIRGPTPKLLRDVKKKSTTRLTLRTPDESTQPIMHEDDENSNTSSSDIFSQVIEESNSNGYHLQFWNNFEKGSLLSVCWKGMDKDKISLYPFYYHVVKPQWNTLYDENNQFYRSRLNKNIERQQLDHDDEEDDTDEPVVGISHTPFKLFDD